MWVFIFLGVPISTVVLHKFSVPSFNIRIRCLFKITIYTVVPAFNGPSNNGHLLCWDTFSMYGLFYHVNVPLMRGPPGERGQLRRTPIINFVILFRK